MNLKENPDLLSGVDTYLTVIGEPFRIENSTCQYVIVRCKCGTIKTALWGDVKSGYTKSCGCFNREGTSIRSTKHMASNTPLYNTWTGMKGRCYTKSLPSYARYGGRGITVCEEWRKDFVPFRDWAMANGWKYGLQIDRIDNDKGYSPENCRIVTGRQNNRNRTSNIHLTHNGQTKIMIEWVEHYGLNYSTVMQRYRRGLRGDALFYGGNYPNSVKGAHKHSEATKRKMSIAQKGLKKPPITEATREKKRQAFLGRVLSQEWKDKIRVSKLAYHQRNRVAQHGYALTPESKIGDVIGLV